MTTTHRTRTTHRQALAMIAYTIVLSLGAAVPFAVSFSQEARPTAQGRVRCGGYQRAEPSETVGRPAAVDQPEAPVAPSPATTPTSSTPAAVTPELTRAAPTSAPLGLPAPPGSRV